jgi:hypothetical protein
MAARFFEAHDTRELEANADWWVSVGIGTSAERRYVVYRACEQTDILQVDDATAWTHAPPSDAAWYVASIFVGRSWEIVVSGDKEKFHAGIKAKVETFGIDLSRQALDEGIQWSVLSRGLEPNAAGNRGILAQTPEAILAAYHRSSRPVPFYVEYRNIPGRPVTVPEHLEWALPPVPDNVIVTSAPLSCSCSNDGSHTVAMTCPVQNLGARSMDVTVKGHALTGFLGYHAEGVARVSGREGHGRRPNPCPNRRSLDGLRID